MIKTKRKIKLDISMIILTICGLVLYLLSYTTGYYEFGKMHSIMILLCLMLAILAELFGVYAREGHPDKEWPHILVTVMIFFICWGIGMILMDRVEAIGTCVVTDFDAGHGGEEAVYISFASIVILLVTVILGIVKSFKGSSIKVVSSYVD